MTKPLALALAFAAVMPAARADDLEALLDNASAGKPVVAGELKPVSPLFYILQTHIQNPNSEQSLFIRHVESGEWNKALLQYSTAFEGTAFQKSPDGRAIHALAHFRAGLPVTGLELLFKTVEAPGKIHPEIRTMWKDAVASNPLVWDVAQIKWQPAFAEIFPVEAAFRVEARELASMKDPAELAKLMNRLPSNSMERARAGWQLVVAHSLRDQVEDAAKVLAQLIKSEPYAVSRDLMELTAARLLYQRGLFAGAIKYYEKVDKTSEYWPDAQEEMAWAYVRKGEPNNALAISQSLVLPAMAVQSGAEAYFVHALSRLKICDYTGVVESLQGFPKIFKPRVQELEKLAASSEIPEGRRAITLLKAGRISRQALGKDARTLPRMVSRDDRLFDLAQAQALLEKEAQAADKLYAESLALTGLQGYFDKLRLTSQTRAAAAAAAANQRVQQLARQEAAEIKEILRKLHIVEAEVIQQVAVAERIAANTKGPVREQKGVTGAKAVDVLKFPADKEVWFDEIGNFRVNVKKSCQAPSKEKST